MGAYITYRSQIKTKQLESEQANKAAERDEDQHFIDTLVTRVEKLELRADALQDKIAFTQQQAEEERRKIIIEYENRVEELRKEMRKLVDNATLELATWRDKYFTLVEDYQRLRIEHAEIGMKLKALEHEYNLLKQEFDKRNDRASRDILDTP